MDNKQITVTSPLLPNLDEFHELLIIQKKTLKKRKDDKIQIMIGELNAFSSISFTPFGI